MSVFVDLEKRLKGDFHLKVAFEAENEILALLGASGCGKSMTLKCNAVSYTHLTLPTIA